MREFAVLQGVCDPDALLADIQRRDAEDFAQRPQDLIELCSDWREHHSHSYASRASRDQHRNEIKTEAPRKERAELSQERAIEGASRLALAAMLTRKLTLRHSAWVDSVDASEAALDGFKILPNWGDRKEPLCWSARSSALRVMAAFVSTIVRWWNFLPQNALMHCFRRGLDQGHQASPVHRDRARHANGSTFYASGRGMARFSRETVFDDIVALDPAVVLDHGDPQSLRPAQRIRALEAYVDLFGGGGWRGLSTPRIQVHRFASPELSDTVKRLWDTGIENPEVRGLLPR